MLNGLMHAGHGEEDAEAHACKLRCIRRRSRGDIDEARGWHIFSRLCRHLLLVALSVALTSSTETGVGASEPPLTVRGVLRQHHKVMLDLVGPYASEESLIRQPLSRLPI